MRRLFKSVVISGLIAGGAMVPAAAATFEESDLDQRLARGVNTNRARNVILFVGDGMGVSSVTAGRILEG